MKPEDFLIKDYELKINYLTNQFQRMWTRFNFFLTIESGLIGGQFIIGNGKFNQELAFAGAVISLIWYIFGAEDRYLVRIYRKHVQNAAQRINENMSQENPASPQHYRPVGEIEETTKELREEDKNKPLRKRLMEWLSGWRFNPISTTRLAALFPLLLFLVWVIALIFLPSK